MEEEDEEAEYYIPSTLKILGYRQKGLKNVDI